MQDAKQQAEQTADRARSKWAQMTTDAAARREDIKAKIEKRADQLDAKAAAADADWAEQDAADALDYAADERAKIAGIKIRPDPFPSVLACLCLLTRSARYRGRPANEPPRVLSGSVIEPERSHLRKPGGDTV